jgi:hypothetical protein
MEWLRQNLAQPEIEYRPEVRWWLAEGFHTDETLKRDIDLIHRAGFGAIEFLAMDEEGAEDSRYGWGSEEWVHDSRVVIGEAARRRLGVSVTSGTNWSTANLTNILPDDRAAAKELNFVRETIAPGQSRRGPLERAALPMPGVREQVLVAVVAGRRIRRTQMGAVLDKESLTVLTGEVREGCLDWTAPGDGIYELLTFWMHGTGQTAEPAQGIAYTVNYVDRYGVDALTAYWDRVVLTPELKELIRENGRVQMYMDSLELKTFGQGGQFWGYTLLEEFKKRRGYDLSPYLPYVVRPYDRGIIGLHHHFYESQDDEFTAKLRTDLCEVQTALYIDNMLKPFLTWLHGAGMTLRAEISYGMPYEISLPGKYVDGIEGESLDFACQPEAFRHFAAAAFLFNKGFSSETGAHRHNYMKGLDFYNQIIFTQFAAGVSRSVLHGYSSIAGAEASTRWPGHEGMRPVFSDRFNIRQPFYRHINDWTAMLARFQMILRRGAPKRDLLMLRLDYHFNGKLHRGNGIRDDVIYETMRLRAHEGIYWKDMSLQDAGFTWDYLAPQLLEEPEVVFKNGTINPAGPGYRALVIFQDVMPLSSARRILQWAKEGLKVLLVNNVTEEIRNEVYATYPRAARKTPYNDQLDGELEKTIGELKQQPGVRVVEDQKDVLRVLGELGIAPRAPFKEPNEKILSFLREDGELRCLFVYHYMYPEKTPYAFTVGIPGRGKPSFVDCWKGTIEEIGAYRCAGGHTWVELTLAAGEAGIIVLEPGPEEARHPVSVRGGAVLRREGRNLAQVFAAGKAAPCAVTFNDGSVLTRELPVPPPLELAEWDLEVESWDEGEKKVIEEDRGLGYVTREVYYETKKTPIRVGKTALIPWKDIPPVGPEVSGIGTYTARFTRPEPWPPGGGAVLRLGSTGGSSLAVYVNGAKAPPVDYSKLEADIGPFLKAGENTLTVEVSSTLNNRLKARGFYRAVADNTGVLVEGKPRLVDAVVQDYGLTGKAEIVFYAVAEL